MRKLVNTIIIITMGAIYCRAQIPKNDALFDTVFVDTFDGSSLKTNKWQPMYPWGQFWRNNKTPSDTDQWCRDIDVAGMNFNPSDTHNRKIDSSTCKLIGRKENKKLERWYWPACSSPGSTPPPCTFPCSADSNCWVVDSIWYKYTNAMLWSKASFKFGYFEIRFRMPNYTPSVYNRFSPTFWLWYFSPETPWSEIDVFEIDGTTPTQNFTNNIWIDTTNVTHDELSIPLPTSQIPSVNISNWHTAAINWTPNYIDFFLDSSLVRRVQHSALKNLIEMPMIVENGVPGTNFCQNDGILDSVNTNFPVTYEIDYVKVWQPKCECSINKNYCSVTESTYVSKIYKSLTLGGTGCSATFNNKSNITAEANDYVLLQEGFEIGNNINMTIDVQAYCSDSMQFHNRTFSPAPEPEEFNQNYNSKHNPN